MELQYLLVDPHLDVYNRLITTLLIILLINQFRFIIMYCMTKSLLSEMLLGVDRDFVRQYIIIYERCINTIFNFDLFKAVKINVQIDSHHF